MKFKNGDRVKIINCCSRFYGATGTVVKTLLLANNYYMLSFCNYYDKFVPVYGPYIESDLKLISEGYAIKRGDGMLEIDLPSDADQDGDTNFKIALNSVYGMMGDYGRGGFTQMFNKDNIPEIRNVYFNDPLTCVIWKDGTKTFVKNADGDHNYDPEKALAMAISKKALGNKYNYYKEFKKWIPENDEKDLLNATEILKKSFTSFGAIAKKYGETEENPVEKAYLTLLKVNDDPTSKDSDFAAAIEEAIGYLGEALDD